MIEPLFGSPMWSSMPTPFPVTGWFQPPAPLANGGYGVTGLSSSQVPLVVTTAGVAASPQTLQAGPQSDPYGLRPGPLAPAQPSVVNPGVTTPGPYAVIGVAAPGFAASDAAAPLTVASLLAAVAQRRGQPMGPTTDQEVEDFIYDALEWLNGANDVEVKTEGARVIVTGSVPYKRLKRDIGEIAWAIPAVNDVQNNLTITARRRSRGIREGEPPPAPGRKQP